MGDEIFLYLLLDGESGTMESTTRDEETQLLLSAPPNPDRDLDGTRKASVEVHVDLARIHLFDAETGEAIVHGLTSDLDSSAVHSATD